VQQGVNSLGHDARASAKSSAYFCRSDVGLPSSRPDRPSTIRFRGCHTCFCGLLPEPITLSSRSRSPAVSQTSMPFLVQPASHARELYGMVRQAYPPVPELGQEGTQVANTGETAHRSQAKPSQAKPSQAKPIGAVRQV
jgi:hypothetical protein